MAEPFQRIEFALQRHQNRIRGDQRIQGKQPERRRAVDQHIIEALGEAGQRFLHAVFPALEIHQLDFRAGQIDRRRHDGLARNHGRRHRSADIESITDYGIDVLLTCGPRNAKAGRGIALRVKVDQQNRLAASGKRRTQIDRGRRLADSALLVDHGNDTRPLLNHRDQRLRPVKHLQHDVCPPVEGSPRPARSGWDIW